MFIFVGINNLSIKLKSLQTWQVPMKLVVLKNVANFETLISYIIAFGTNYNPTKSSLTNSKLQKFYLMQSVIKHSKCRFFRTFKHYSCSQIRFKPLSKLVTRVNNALKATDTTTQVDDNAKTIVRKLQGIKGQRKTYRMKRKKALRAEGKDVNQISTSQMGFNDRLENFDKLIALLSSIPNYAPNRRRP